MGSTSSNEVGERLSMRMVRSVLEAVFTPSKTISSLQRKKKMHLPTIESHSPTLILPGPICLQRSELKRAPEATRCKYWDQEVYHKVAILNCQSV